MHRWSHYGLFQTTFARLTRQDIASEFSHVRLVESQCWRVNHHSTFLQSIEEMLLEGCEMAKELLLTQSGAYVDIRGTVIMLFHWGQYGGILQGQPYNSFPGSSIWFWNLPIGSTAWRNMLECVHTSSLSGSWNTAERRRLQTLHVIVLPRQCFLKNWSCGTHSGHPFLTKEDCPDAALPALNMCQSVQFPKVFEVLKILVVVPVVPVTRCEAERSFSGLRQLKVYTRANMLEGRLKHSWTDDDPQRLWGMDTNRDRHICSTPTKDETYFCSGRSRWCRIMCTLLVKVVVTVFEF